MISGRLRKARPSTPARATSGSGTSGSRPKRLAYLQLGWAATEIIHREDLLGRHGWSAEYSVVPGAPGPLLSQLAAKNVDAIDMSFALAAKAFEEGVPLKQQAVPGVALTGIRPAAIPARRHNAHNAANWSR